MRLRRSPLPTYRRLPFEATRIFAAAIVLVTTFQTPVQQHAHAGGDHPHRHADEHQHAANANGGLHGVCADSLASEPFPRLAGVTPHIHVFWLGFEFTLPAGSLPHEHDDTGLPGGDHHSGQRTGAAGGGCTFFQLNEDAHYFGPTVCDQLLVPPVADTLGLLPPLAGEFHNLPRFCSRPVPLCDAARHERSGVQLA